MIFSVSLMFKSDFRFVRPGWLARRVNDIHDALKDGDDDGFVNVEPLFEFLFQRGELFRQFAFVPQQRAHFDESPNDEDAHLGSARALEDICRLEGAVLGKDPRAVGGTTPGVWNSSQIAMSSQHLSVSHMFVALPLRPVIAGGRTLSRSVGKQNRRGIGGDYV